MMPATYAELTDVFAKLEKHYADMQDVEFTVEEEKLLFFRHVMVSAVVWLRSKSPSIWSTKGWLMKKRPSRVEPSSVERFYLLFLKGQIKYRQKQLWVKDSMPVLVQTSGVVVLQR